MEKGERLGVCPAGMWAPSLRPRLGSPTLPMRPARPCVMTTASSYDGNRR